MIQPVMTMTYLGEQTMKPETEIVINHGCGCGHIIKASGDVTSFYIERCTQKCDNGRMYESIKEVRACRDAEAEVEKILHCLIRYPRLKAIVEHRMN